MSLQDLRLPIELLIDLYANHLVEPDTGTPDNINDKKNKSLSLPTLGGNEKRITILVREESQPFMKDDELEWLQKMLQACKLTLGDVAIVNTHSKNFSMALVKQQLRPGRLVMLGPSPTDLQLPLNFPQFKIQEHDRCIYLFAPAAKELNQETKEGKLLKSKLWLSLQKLFEV